MVFTSSLLRGTLRGGDTRVYIRTPSETEQKHFSINLNNLHLD